MNNFAFPKRIVCLTEETTETLYAIGASDLIVGITRYTKRPEIARKEKKIVSGYIDAKIDKIVALKPDLVLTWSDLQADIAKELIKAGIEVYAFNHRSLDGIIKMIVRLGAIVGKQNEAIFFADVLQRKIDDTRSLASQFQTKPKIYFEEWYDPIITGISWVSEIIEVCGAIDIFAENRKFPDAKSRILADNQEVVRRNPDIILASWCGKKFKESTLIKRESWNNISAVQNKEIYELAAEVILQPGPAAIIDGIPQITTIIENWRKRNC